MEKIKLFALIVVMVTGMSCRPRKFNNDAKGKSDSASEFTMKSYVQSCEEKLGPIPKVDCNEIDEALVWSYDQQGKIVRVADEDVPGFSIAWKPHLKCVNAAIGGPLESRCAPLERFGKVFSSETDPQTTWVAACQKGGKYLQRSNPRVESVGLIGASPKGVCFFTTGTPEGGVENVLPSPREDTNVWVSQKDWPANGIPECVRCHMPQPFIRTPLMRHRDVARAIGVTAANFRSVSEFNVYMEGDAKAVSKLDYGPKGKSPKLIPVTAKMDIKKAMGKDTFFQSISDENAVASCNACHTYGGSWFHARHALQAFGICDGLKQNDRHCQSLHPNTPASYRNIHASVYAPEFPRLTDSVMKKHPEMADYFNRCADPKTHSAECKFSFPED